MGTNSAIGCLRSDGEKVLQRRLRSEAAAEPWTEARSRKSVRLLEAASDVDDELAAFENRLEGGPSALPLLSPPTPTRVFEPVKVARSEWSDSRELKRSIDSL